METVDLINSWSAQTALELLGVILSQTVIVLIVGKLVPGVCDRVIKAVSPDSHEDLKEDVISTQSSLDWVEMTGHCVIGLLAVMLLAQRYVEFGFLFVVLFVIGGIAVRDSLSNLLAAWLIRWDQSIEVGDQVRIPRSAGKSEVSGEVEAIGWGTTRIRAENSDETMEVPNRELQNLRYVVKREKAAEAIADQPA